MNRFLAALRRHLRDRGDEVFCRVIARGGTETVRWRDFGAAIGGFAAAYRARRVSAGGVVAIFLRAGPSQHAAYLAAMMSGRMPTFLAAPSPRQDPAIYWASLRALLAHLDCGAVVLDRATLAEMRAAGLALDGGRVIPVEEVAAAGEVPEEDIGDDAVALLQHSSGTTGRKKGVALSYRALAAQLDSYGRAIAIGRDDCIVSWLPLYHDMGLMACFLLPAYAGVPFVQLDPFEWVSRPRLLLDAIADHRGTLAWLPNFAFAHLAAAVRGPARDVSSMRAFIDCSEPCRPETLARFAARFAAWGARPEMLQACYAMAETGFAVTQTPLGSAPRARQGLLNLGRPIAGIEISIRGRDGAPVADGGFGEITLRGACLFDGYYRDPALTAERWRDGWFHSRDRGAVIGGELYIAGRYDDLLIVNGRNIHAHEIEAAVDALGLTHPGRCAAFTTDDERTGSAALVIVAERAAADEAADEEAAVAAIAERVRSIFDVQPRDVRLVPRGWIAKTTSGKVGRADNRRKYLAAEMAHV